MAELSGFGMLDVLEECGASGLAGIQLVLVPSPAWSWGIGSGWHSARPGPQPSLELSGPVPGYRSLRPLL